LPSLIAPVLHARLERNRKEADAQQAEAALKESESALPAYLVHHFDISYSCTTGGWQVCD